MGRIGKALRFEILARDGFRCRYCGATAANAELHIDHVLPLALGVRQEASRMVIDPTAWPQACPALIDANLRWRNR